VARDGGHEVVRDDAHGTAELEDVPTFFTEQLERGAFLQLRVAFTGDGFDEGRLAAAVGAEDCDVFAYSDGEREVIERKTFASADGNILELDQRKSGRQPS